VGGLREFLLQSKICTLRMSRDSVRWMGIYEYSYYNRRDAPLRMSRNTAGMKSVDRSVLHSSGSLR